MTEGETTLPQPRPPGQRTAICRHAANGTGPTNGSRDTGTFTVRLPSPRSSDTNSLAVPQKTLTFISPKYLLRYSSAAGSPRGSCTATWVRCCRIRPRQHDASVEHTKRPIRQAVTHEQELRVVERLLDVVRQDLPVLHLNEEVDVVVLGKDDPLRVVITSVEMKHPRIRTARRFGNGRVYGRHSNSTRSGGDCGSCCAAPAPGSRRSWS